MPATLDQIMEDASQRMAVLDYLGAEALCLQALAHARGQQHWGDYARVLLPLQECRRQRRMTAADATIQLGTDHGIPPLHEGCLLLTHPATADQAATLLTSAGNEQRCVEVLWADNPASADRWTLRSFSGPNVSCEVAAPAGLPLNQPLQDTAIAQAAHWFIGASEALGDAALAQVSAPLGSLERIEQLEARVAAISDHEILHQRLGDAARAMPPHEDATA